MKKILKFIGLLSIVTLTHPLSATALTLGAPVASAVVQTCAGLKYASCTTTVPSPASIPCTSNLAKCPNLKSGSACTAPFMNDAKIVCTSGNLSQ